MHDKYNKRGHDHHNHLARIANAEALGLPRRALADNPSLIVSDSSTSPASTSATPDIIQPFTTSQSSSSISTPAVTSSSSSTDLTTSSPTPTTPTLISTSSSDSNSDSSSSSSSSSSSLSSSTPQTTIPSITSVHSVAPIVQSFTSTAKITQVTYVQPSRSVAASATPSPSVAPASSASASVIVGCIAGGLVGLAGLIFATMFFMRRWRKRGEDESEFDADAFRRQSAILIDDEPSPFANGRGNGGRGYNPRPPTMIERHIAGRTPFDSPPMPSLQQYNNIGANGYGNDYPPPPSFSPGQVMPSATVPPPTQTGMQFFAPYGQSPVTSPTAYDSAYNEHGQLVRRPSNGAAIFNEQGQLSRHASNAMYGDLPPPDATGGNPHYVDLARSSVSPFQAAQYAEISRQLNVEAPTGLHTVDENEDEVVQSGGHAISPEGDDSNQESPFADPQSPVEGLERPPALTDAEGLVPPSPIYSMNPTKTSRDRIQSYPPKLPEIQVQERTFSPTSYDFPQTPSAIPTPSPLAANFNIPGPQAGEQLPRSLSPGFAAADPAAAQTTAEDTKKSEIAPKPRDQRPASTYTVYDEADAYGGF